MKCDSLSLFGQWLFKAFRSEKDGSILNGNKNLFLRLAILLSMNRRLKKDEKNYYMKSFKTLESRKPMIRFPQELPFSGSKSKNEKIAEKYFLWLKESPIPKLLLYAIPGVQIKESNVRELKEITSNLTTICVGQGKHFIN